MNIITANENECIIIRGPSKVRILSGNVEALGFQIQEGKSVFVKKYWCLPIEIKTKAVIEIVGEEVNYSIIKDDLFSLLQWKNIISEYLLAGGDAIVMGPVNSAKACFTLFIANMLIRQYEGSKVGILDVNPNRGDINIPGFIGAIVIEKPIFDLEETKLFSSQFLGSLSPFPYQSKFEEMIAKLFNKTKKICKYVIINFHDWIYGEKAIKHIQNVIITNNIKNIFIIGEEKTYNILKSMLRNDDFKVYFVEEPSIQLKDNIIGYTYRQRKLKRYINNYDGLKVYKVPLNLIEGYSQAIRLNTVWSDTYRFLANIIKDDNLLDQLHKYKILWIWKLSDKNSIKEYMVKVDKELIFHTMIVNKNTKIYIVGRKCGLIAGIYHRGSWFLGFLESFNIKRNEVIMFVPKFMNINDIRRIKIGQILINYEGNELGVIPGIEIDK